MSSSASDAGLSTVVGEPRPGAPDLILASASPSRAAVLRQAGLTALSEPAQVDEAEIKAALRAEGAGAHDVAETLAELKAQRISRRRSGAFVIGADQMLECEGIWLDKPADVDQAAAHLRFLSAKTHNLVSAVCVVHDGTRLWHHVAAASLTMRPLSEDFIAAYLGAVGAAALTSVGAYQLEGLGAQLFARVEGDYFSILGLPLLPLMDFLRNHGVIAA